MWDPAQYLHFADHRGRPFHELVARVGAAEPRRVADLGCGPGTLTETLVARWPGAVIEAIDSSPEMVDEARERGLDARVCGIEEWKPAPDTDVVVTNAALQWVPGHPDLLVRWVGQLPSRAWIAGQIPGNFGAPSHALVRELVAEPSWRAELEPVRLREEDAVLDPDGYAALMADAGAEVDAWETTYLQRLEGPDPVLDWITGTALRPIRAALADGAWEQFRAELAPRLRSAYPSRADGTTWFPFRRVFFVART